MAAAMLAHSIVTMMPVPAEGADQHVVEQMVHDVPRYHELIDAWRWCAPMWESGLIASVFNGNDPAQDVRAVVNDIHDKRELRGLAGLVDKAVYHDERSYIAALSLDLLRGGPDPSVCVPIACGLDRFACRHGFVSVRSEPVSLVQRTEARVAKKIAAAAIPVFLQADADTIAQTRVMLEPELEALRTVLDHATENADLGVYPQQHLRAAASRYTDAFDEVERELAHEHSKDEARLVSGTVSINLVSFPYDTALAAGAAAAKSMGFGTAKTPADSPSWQRDSGSRITSMIVKLLARSTH